MMEAFICHDCNEFNGWNGHLWIDHLVNSNVKRSIIKVSMKPHRLSLMSGLHQINSSFDSIRVDYYKFVYTGIIVICFHSLFKWQINVQSMMISINSINDTDKLFLVSTLIFYDGFIRITDLKDDITFHYVICGRWFLWDHPDECYINYRQYIFYPWKLLINCWNDSLHQVCRLDTKRITFHDNKR